MATQILKTFLEISFVCLIFIGCNTNYDLESEYLNSKNCEYKLIHSDNSLFLDYHLVLDTSTFELANVDTSRFTIYQSAYFAWHVNYISYRILKENEDFENITIFWKSDTSLNRTLFTISKNRNDLFDQYNDSLHYYFISYMIDSIPVEDYFTLNKILNDLYGAYRDPRLTWNYAHLINQFEKFQCGNKQEHVSFEIFMLIDIGIRMSILDEKKKEDLLRYNSFYISHCLPDRELLNEEFDKLDLNFSDE